MSPQVALETPNLFVPTRYRSDWVTQWLAITPSDVLLIVYHHPLFTYLIETITPMLAFHKIFSPFSPINPNLNKNSNSGPERVGDP